MRMKKSCLISVLFLSIVSANAQTSGNVFNVVTYGADVTGVADSHTAIVNAISAAAAAGGGTVYFPAGNFRNASPLLDISSRVTLQGTYDGASIVCDLAVSPCVQIGNVSHTVFGGHINNLIITRATGSIPIGSIGLWWAGFSYATEENVTVGRNYYNRYMGGGPGGNQNVGLNRINPKSYSASGAYEYYNNLAQVQTYGGALGQNGGEGEITPSIAMILVDTTADSLYYTDTVFVPTGGSNVNVSLMYFINYTDVGDISFTNVNCENFQVGFTTDANTPKIGDLRITGGRLAISNTLFNLNSATQLIGFRMNNVNTAASVILVNPRLSAISNSVITGVGNFVGGATASMTLTGNNFNSNLTLAGPWAQGLSATGNNIIGTFSNNATGSVAVGNNANP